ncbi:MAG: hypothetical protein A2Z95_01795 [Gallionellales bacterium GWA2_60_18]|nr:MAG: hypothetical protein A2Z95_01795 [Gallionellales bacterium GWA2_60_18]
MYSHLQSENLSLRHRLESLLHEARQNEDKMRRFDQLQRQLIGADSLSELIRLLLSEYMLVFGVEFVTLALVDREYEVTRLLEGWLGVDADCSGLTLLRSTDTLDELYGGKRGTFLGAFDASAHQAIFNAPLGWIASVALLPLTRHGELIGSLHFGSADSGRYVAGCGTDFLERLSGVIAVCLESALSNERLKRTGLTDALTGVQNRRYFEHRCQIEISQARRHKHQLACMFLDVDKFKRINDTYGHQTGDEVLKSVATVIKSQLRGGDTIARYGGEEFIVLLPQIGLTYAHQIAERIRCRVAAKALQADSGQPIEITISIGLAMLPCADDGVEDRALGERLIAAADKALYQAKHSGRNRVVCADDLPSEPALAPLDSLLRQSAVAAGRTMLAMLAVMKFWKRAWNSSR